MLLLGRLDKGYASVAYKDKLPWNYRTEASPPDLQQPSYSRIGYETVPLILVHKGICTLSSSITYALMA